MMSNGKYLYCFTNTIEEFQPGLAGIDSKPVHTITEDSIAAVVSDCSHSKIRPERKKLKTHYDVIKEILKTSTVLPVSFGVVADDAKGIKKILHLNHDSLLNQLHRLRGKVEMGLKVMWDVENIFEFMVRSHRSLELFRDDIFLKPAGATMEEKMELGRMFESILEQEREKHTTTVQNILKPYCCEIKTDKVKDEKTIMKLSCLVEKARQDPFEEGVFEAAKTFDNNYAFDFNGPWAPYNFVSMNLRLE